MSRFKLIKTKYRNAESLIKVLADVGWAQVEIVPNIHDSTLVLYGYEGDDLPERASIRIERRYITSASNDLGFA